MKATRLAIYLTTFLTVSSGLSAQASFILPIELGQGGAFAESNNFYSGSIRLHPSITVGSFALGATGVAAIVDRQSAVLAGPRAAFRIPIRFDPIPVGNVYLAAEALWGTNMRRQVGGAVTFDLAGGVGLFTARVARDLEQKFTLFEIGIGTDIWFWLKPSPEEI